MTEEKKTEKPYVPHFEKVDEIKKEAQHDISKRLLAKKKITLTPQLMRLGEVMSKLMSGTATAHDFTDFLSFESSLQTDTIMRSFQRRSLAQDAQGNFVAYTKSYGEDMSYNEGFQHGLFRFKGEREEAMRKYLEILKQEQETK